MNPKWGTKQGQGQERGNDRLSHETRIVQNPYASRVCFYVITALVSAKNCPKNFGLYQAESTTGYCIIPKHHRLAPTLKGGNKRTVNTANAMP